MLDWGVPDELDADNDLERYVDLYLPRAVAAVRRESGSDEVTLVGYCLGGVLAALYAAAHEDAPVRNLILMATPVDFDEMGAMVAFLREGRLNAEELVDDTGNVPADVALQRLLHAGADHRDRPEGDAAGEPLERRVRRGLPGDGAVVARPRAVPRRGVPPARRGVRPQERADDRVDPARRPQGRPRRRRAATCSTRWPSATTSSRPRRSSRSCELVGDPARREELRLPGGHVTFGTGRSAVKHTMPRLAGWIIEHSDELPEPKEW